jgi:hypothetical protein
LAASDCCNTVTSLNICFSFCEELKVFPKRFLHQNIITFIFYFFK